MSRETDGNSTAPQAGDGELVRATRRGQLEAFEVLVGRYQRRATLVAYRLLSNRDEAMEITQDAFLRAYEKLGSLSRPQRFGPWLLRIVSNLALNKRRARALRKMPSLDMTGEDNEGHPIGRPDTRAISPLQAVSAQELQERIEQELETLPEMQRTALVLFSIEKMPQKEVAEILGCSVEAVKWHVFTARKKLKEKFKDYL